MNFYRICLLLFSASFLLCGCSRHQKPEPIQTEPVAVETEIGGYISGSTETELSTEALLWHFPFRRIPQRVNLPVRLHLLLFI